MNSCSVTTIMVLLCLRLFTFAQSDLKPNEVKFGVGSNAREIKALKWIKGSPFSNFEKGRVYVVEFGATWCGPCRAAMPYLTKLSKRYSGNVTVLSFFVWENGFGQSKDTFNTAYVSRVERYVEKMGDKMAYNVAIDDPQQTMAYTWMTAAGQSSIPSVFLIDQRGVVVWISKLGYDIMQLEKAVHQVVNGEFNTESAVEEQIERNSVYEKIKKAKKDGNYKTALFTIDSLIARYPQNTSFYTLKFDILLDKNEDDAYVFGWKVLKNQCKDTESALTRMAANVINRSEVLESPDWDLAIALCKRAFELSSYGVFKSQILQAEARVYMKKGDFKKAEALVKEAFTYLEEFDRIDVANHYIGLEDIIKQINEKKRNP